MEWLIISGIAAALMFAGKSKSKKTTTDSSITPDPLNIDSMVPTSASDSSSSSSKFSDATVLPSGTPKYGAPAAAASKKTSSTIVTKPAGSPGYSKYNQELADGVHAVMTTAETTIYAVDKSVDISMHPLKPAVPSGQYCGIYSGMVYTSSKGRKYFVANGYNKGQYFYIPFDKAKITTSGLSKSRIIITDLKSGSYTNS
ncbi:hypothetical protein SDC9_55311 [bioreactor metagenome]|uniref:Uncharacterized protein n=1 Tax=bioreactor metagenome TaxID=1076179 RepID=A0A644WYK7_9ZZZZ